MSLSLAATVRPAASVRHAGANRFRAWVRVADVGETQWAMRRGTAAKIACWSLVAILIIGAFAGRANLSPDPLTAFLLTAANAIALLLAIASLRHAQVPPVMYASILGILLVGGILQIYLLSYNFPRNSAFVNDQLPFHSWIGSSDISQAYGYLTLAFVVFCLLAAVLTAIPLRAPIGRASTVTKLSRFTTLLVWASIGYVGFTVLQLTFGIGQAALYNKPLPFRLVAITLFYQRDFYPALLLLGIWVYDRHQPKLAYLCLVGTGVVAASLSYGTTSRGSIIRFGLPLLFLWLLTGRFTKFRKSLVIAGFALYLVLAPILSAIRVDRVRAATGASPSTARPTPLSAESLNYELGHFVFRVGGAGSMMFAMRRQDELSLGGLQRAFRPSGLTSYFTHDVIGRPRHATVASSQAPTVLGLGTLVGGPQGMVMVLVFTVLAFDMLARLIAKRLWTWPVALSILTYTIATFFSEGTPIIVYKSLLAVTMIEIIWRFAGRRGSRVAFHQLAR